MAAPVQVVVEVAHVQREAALGLESNDLPELRDVSLRIAVRRQAHHLAFVRCKTEAQVLGDRPIDHTNRVRESNLIQLAEGVAFTNAEPSRRPFTYRVQ